MDESHTEVIEKAPPPHRKIRRKATRKQIAQIIDRAARGVPMTEIAQTIGVTQPCVQQILDEFTPIFRELPNLEKFRTIRADVLDAASLTCLRSAMRAAENPDHPPALHHAAGAFERFYRASRLERGLSTDNKSVHSDSHLSVSLSRLDSDDE